jgi:hypothetical protein
MRGQHGTGADIKTAASLGTMAILFAVFLVRFCGAESPAADTSKSLVDAKTARTALVKSFRTNVEYSREWLEAKDYRSLKQSADSLVILSEAIGRYAPAPADGKMDALRRATGDLGQAATDSKTEEAEAALAKIGEQLTAIESEAVADAPAPVRKTSAGFTPLMHLIDGTFTDARMALAVGDSETAKSNAAVLTELGQYLAVDRNGAQWREQAGDLVKAASEIAVSKTNDPKALREDFHLLYANCEACHHRR